MKVLLCLLSDQHVPNLLSVHHFSPDRLVLIESTAMKRKQAASNFLRALGAGGLDYGAPDRHDILPLEYVNDLNVIRSCLQQAYGKYPSAKWIANVTGGMKPMSIAAYEFFKALGARVVYIDAAKPDLILGLDGGPPEHCQHELSIREFVAGYGFEASKSDEAIRLAEERAGRWWPCARAIAQHAPDRDLLTSREESQEARKNGLQLEPRHLTGLPAEVQDSLQQSLGLEASNGVLTGKLDKYAGKFLTGEWLDQFVWSLLHRHAKVLGLNDAHLGVEAKRGDAASDFDVAFIRGYALGAVECKSGTQEHGDDPNAPLDKLEARMQQFRALRVNPILVTTSKRILDAKGDLKLALATRASVYGCRIVTVNKIQALASRPEDGEFLRTTLFGRT